MVTSPVEYFESQDFIPEKNNSELTQTEHSIIQNFLGIDIDESKEKRDDAQKKYNEIPDNLQRSSIKVDIEMSTDKYIREVSELQLVGFLLGDQLYAIPTIVVQEVIRKMPTFRLPVASAVVSGVIRLRGDVTPLVRLRNLLKIRTSKYSECDMFTIVCRFQKLQVGMQIDAIQSMYRVYHEDIQWNVDSLLGIAAEYVIGLFKLHEKIVPILSIERIVEEVFQK